jgi:hypothetical protein
MVFLEIFLVEMSFFPSSCIAFHSISLRSASVRGSVVNLRSYLTDQLLRGCQSADNQFQALQNQEFEVVQSMVPGFLS